jgi:hypothetical protein
VAALFDQDGSTRQSIFDLDAVTSDGYRLVTRSPSSFAVTRSMMVLALNNTAPVDRRNFWPPHIGAP